MNKELLKIPILCLLILIGAVFLQKWVVERTFRNNINEWFDSAQVIYKLENNQYTQITSFDQIKDGVYIIIR